MKREFDKKDGPNRDLNPGPPAPKEGIIPLDHLATEFDKKDGPNGDLNPGPPAPKAGIIPLDHLATCLTEYFEL